MCLAVPGMIVSMTDTETIARTGKVRFGNIEKEINLAFVPEAKLGDYVLVHVGVAISVVKESEAKEIFDYLDNIAEKEGNL